MYLHLWIEMGSDIVAVVDPFPHVLDIEGEVGHVHAPLVYRFLHLGPAVDNDRWLDRNQREDVCSSFGHRPGHRSGPYLPLVG